MATVLRSRCAFARLFAGKTGQILNNSTDLGIKSAPESLSTTLASRSYSSYAKSPFADKISEQYNYEIVKNPPEWAFVEQLLPFETIPKVKPKDSYPSGWVPPKEEAVNHPYFLKRNKNHEIPIYLNLYNRGARKITRLKGIDGDIWLLNDEIKSLLKKKHNKYVETRVHELGTFIDVKGDYVNDLQEWAFSKGF
ncbi:probable 39S ribosomal protein L49, mitochondrial [Ostrinia furnacalis]|uniref:probable 39S ribosomal protein L49, mitochondrial n=1 Tax=Ostrinia furnacalis TaxID=93504 RepID=UPI00103F17FE|nr:probable 39S ribosomal protein L49, mitochondrial [Ostrinia furnacalis]